MLTVFRLILLTLKVGALMLIMNVQSVHAQRVIQISSGIEQLELTQNIEFLRDESGQLSVDDVQSLEQNFTPTKFPFSGGYTKAVHWFRFSLQRNEGTADNWLLTVAPGYIDSVRLYSADQNTPSLLDEVGDDIAIASRQLTETFTPFSMRVNLPDHEAHTFYLRLETASTSVLKLSLATPELTALNSATERLFSGVIIGMMCISLLYGLSMHALAFNYAYLMSSLYIVGSLLLRLTVSGIAGQYLFPNIPEVTTLFGATGTCLQTSGFVVFFIFFYETKLYFPRLHYYLVFVAILSFVTFVSIFFEYYVVFAPPLLVATFIALVVIAYISWRGMRDKVAGGVSIFVGVVLYSSLIALNLLMINGMLPAYSWLINAPQFGTLLFIAMMLNGLHKQHFQVQLEKRASEVDIKIANEKIAREKQLRQDQSRFISMVAHEMKTPLAVVDSAVQILSLQSQHLDASSTANLERIRNVIYYLSELINNALISESIDHSTLQPYIIDNPCQVLIDKTLQIISSDKNRFQRDIDPNLCCQADAFLLDIVVKNLLINAKKYSKNNSLTSINAVENNFKGQPGIRISVTNESQSKTKPDINSWVEKYYRQPDQSNIQGFGLGLYLVNEIMRAHRGHLEIELISEHPPWQVQTSVWFPLTDVRAN